MHNGTENAYTVRNKTKEFGTLIQNSSGPIPRSGPYGGSAPRLALIRVVKSGLRAGCCLVLYVSNVLYFKHTV